MKKTNMYDANLQKQIPWYSAALRALPGVQPLKMSEWLYRSESFDQQMAQRDQLISQSLDAVHALDASGHNAARELMRLVLDHLSADAGYAVGSDSVLRPDGVPVSVDNENPLITLGRLCQEDFCILTKKDDCYILSGAILCFPASWRLSEKFMRSLADIHIPVPAYTTDIAKRVDRLFAGVQPNRPLWRSNALWYEDPSLFQPRSQTEPRKQPGPDAPYLRSERQCIMRLPETGAVVFSIHTAVVHTDARHCS